MFFSNLIYMNGMDMPLNVIFMKPQPDVELHDHEFSELVVVLSGTADYLSNSGMERIKRGDILLTYVEQQHGYANTSGDFSIGNIIYDSTRMPLPALDMCGSMLFNRLFNGKPSLHRQSHIPILSLSDKDLETVSCHMNHIYTEKQNRAVGNGFGVLAEFMQLIVFLVRISAQADHKEWHIHQSIANLITYLNTHYKEKINLPVMAEIARMSPRTLSRHFEAATGDTPVNYLLHKRIAHAASLLQGTGMAVSEVAFAVGFNDGNYFSRQFHRITKQTPLEFRRRTRS